MHAPQTSSRRRFAALLATALLGLNTALTAQAQAWPAKPVKILVGFPGGSTPDIAARVLAESLARAWGQPVLVDNKPGASGNLAADAAAKASDDHTLAVVINGNLTTAKALNPKLPFDPAKDFSLITLLATAPLVVLSSPDQPVGAAWVAKARESNNWSYGSVGIGSIGHLGMEVIKSVLGNKSLVHVPYNGNPAVLNAMLGGQVQVALVPPGLAMPHAKAGKLHAVAITGAASALAPGVPPLADLGLRFSPLEVWVGLVGPSSLSAPARARIGSDVQAALADEGVRARLLAAGWEAKGGRAEDFERRVTQETATLGALIRDLGIKLE